MIFWFFGSVFLRIVANHICRACLNSDSVTFLYAKTWTTVLPTVFSVITCGSFIAPPCGEKDCGNRSIPHRGAFIGGVCEEG